MKPRSVTFASPLVETESLKKLAIFFDSVALSIASWGWASVDPNDLARIEEEGEDPDRPLKGRVKGVLSPDLLSRDPEIGLLLEEGVVSIQTPPLRLMEQVEEEASLHEYFAGRVENGMMQINLDGKLLLEGHSRLLDCADVDVEDFENTFYFLALAAYTQMATDTKPLLTDSPTISEMLRFAHQQAGTRLSSVSMKHSQRAKCDLLTAEVGRVMLPNLEVISVEEILELRFKLSDELEAFRAQIASLASTITVEPYREGFENAIAQVIDAKIRPTITEIEAKLRLTPDKLLLRIAKGLKKPDSYLPLVSSVFLDVPTAAAVLASAGLVVGEAILETHIENSQLKHQGNLAFLLETRKALA